MKPRFVCFSRSCGSAKSISIFQYLTLFQSSGNPSNLSKHAIQDDDIADVNNMLGGIILTNDRLYVFHVTRHSGFVLNNIHWYWYQLAIPIGYSNRPIPLYIHVQGSQELTRDLSDKLVLTCSMSKHPLICPPLDWEPH